MYLFILAIVLACSNDIDILKDAVINDPVSNIEERDSAADESEDETPPEDEQADEYDIEDDFESRITEFPPIEDVYVQSGQGFNQTIIRLDENYRTSYLKFDLQAIDTIGGYITDATLKFTVDSDEGNGTINIYKGIGTEWTEQQIDNKNAPEVDILLGAVVKEYKIGSTEEVVLSGTDLLPEKTSLILQHHQGNDLAIASKEHPSKIGPKLIVKYNAPKNSDAIIIVEEEPSLPNEDETPEEENGPAENEAPIAIADATPTSGGVPLAVSFTGGNSTDDDTITSYSWDFKDGSTATTANPTHTFTELGTFEAELTVMDAEGLISKDAVTITVNEDGNAAPVARISASPLSGTTPLEVSFTGSNSSDDNGIASYSWNFKDGGTANNANPTHTFNLAGSYVVELTVTDENGLSDQESITITVSELNNQAPVAVTTANPQSGTVPLEVNFTGSNSTDDNGVTSYSWDFKDGSTSNTTNPTHTFGAAGTYDVTLTVEDESGLKDTDTISITVNSPNNTAPNAVATANPLSGDAPLTVNFTGSNSTDDNGVVSYYWDLPGNPSSTANTTHTFNDPGVYNVTLTVTDAAGLTDTTTLTINVSQGGGGNSPCVTDGGKAGDTGLKVWCVDDMENPLSGSFANGDLKVDKDGSNSTIPKENGKIKFNLTPDGSGNKRAEIRTAPWNVRNPVGTEEWFGWSYTFSNDYIIDQNNQWKFFQVHNGIVGESPQIGLEIINKDQFSGHSAGELYVTNSTTSQNYNPTGITPTAGQTLDIVVHVIWGNASNGLLEVWIDGNKIYNKQQSTVFSAYPWAGNAKWGIYKWPWSSSSNVQESANQGISNLTTYMGNIKMITRRPGDSNYGVNSYSTVAPN